MEDEAKWRQPVGPAGQPAAGHGQHGRRDPEPSREELLVRLDWVVAVDATRADDRNPQPAIPEPVPHPADPHVAGHHDRGEPRRAQRMDRPPVATTPSPARASDQFRPPADAFVLRDPDEPGHGVVMEKDGAIAAPGVRVGQRSAAAAADARNEGTADAGSWCGSSGRRDTRARQGRACRRVRPRGRTRAPPPAAMRRPPGQPVLPEGVRVATAPLAHTRSHRGWMPPDRPGRAPHRIPSPRVSGPQPNEKTEASAIAIASARLGINGEAARLAAARWSDAVNYHGAPRAHGLRRPRGAFPKSTQGDGKPDRRPDD